MAHGLDKHLHGLHVSVTRLSPHFCRRTEFLLGRCLVDHHVVICDHNTVAWENHVMQAEWILCLLHPLERGPQPNISISVETDICSLSSEDSPCLCSQEVESVRQKLADSTRGVEQLFGSLKGKSVFSYGNPNRFKSVNQREFHF